MAFSVEGSIRSVLGSIGAIRHSLFPSYLGIDIGTTSIKIIETKPGKQLPEVANYAFSEESRYLGRPQNALQTSSLKLFDEEVSEVMEAVLSKMKPKSTEVIASLPVFSAFITVLTFPDMPAGELQKSLKFEARQYIPLPISEVAIDWRKVGSYEDEKGIKFQQVLLISVPQEQIKKYQRLFSVHGLHLRVLEIESLSLGRVLIGSDPTPTVIVDIGSRSTNIAFFAKGQLRFNSQSDFGGASITQALASSLNINPRRAEELKRERGIVGTGAEYELSTIMLPFVDAIIGDVKKSEFNYKNQFPNSVDAERIMLCGGGANLMGIDKYFEREFGKPVVRAAPFLHFEYSPLVEPLINDLNPFFAVALGLGMSKLQ